MEPPSCFRVIPTFRLAIASPYIGVGTAAAGAAMAAALFDIKLLIFIIFTNNMRHDKRRTVPLLLSRDHYLLRRVRTYTAVFGPQNMNIN